ncbi:Isoleucine--tRNA ligase, mitochondrial [Nymphon striatum]|nr:Isoleucine--tRNA ligase, mitochondrial [Nymphon striatum]
MAMRYTCSLGPPQHGDTNPEQQNAQFSELYSWQYANKKESPEFCIHDGPPYANGKPHIGHAINKILKDITNRYKLLRGYRIHFVPGWDCHGLPIELKATDGIDSKSMPAIEIRRKAQKFAEKSLKIQKKEFEKWGIMADWNNPYYSFHPDYIISELQHFSKLYEEFDVEPENVECQSSQAGAVPTAGPRDVDDVIAAKRNKESQTIQRKMTGSTALAESELEYDENFKSKALYLKYEIKKISNNLRFSEKPLYALIWTTTPWTLPANKAICFNPHEKYSTVECEETGDNLIVATKTLPNLEKVTMKSFSIKNTYESEALSGATYYNYFSKDFCPLISAATSRSKDSDSFVTVDKGTGLVHTAPSHGLDDYVIGLNHKLSMDNFVDEEGKYTSGVGEDLQGKFVLTDGNEAIIEKLNQAIFHQQSYTHSYPLDWRTKTPVIIRCSKQWFMNTDKIKLKAEESLKNVSVFPSYLKSHFIKEINRQQHWCISRQRKWGVPIPVFYDKQNGKPIMNKKIIQHLCSLIKSKGIHCWWTLPIEELLLPEMIPKDKMNISDNYEKGEDILDIWFDSGCSWNFVLGDQRKADYCLEGLDQLGGWFRQSLFTRVGILGDAPYKNLYVHGFAVDEKGKKMSKSLGNVVDPVIITDGGEDKNLDPAYGVDVLRWFVANHVHQMKVRIGSNFLKISQDSIVKLKKVSKFILGTLDGFDISSHNVALQDMDALDQYMLNQIYVFNNTVTDHFETLSYSKVGKLILDFVITDVSGVYVASIKDRLYCDGENSLSRRSCQTVLFHLLDCLTTTIAPIMPHFAEEVYQYHPSNWFKCDEQWANTELYNKMACALEMRLVFNKSLEETRTPSQECDVIIEVGNRLYDDLKIFQSAETSGYSSLCELFKVSRCTLIKSSEQISVDTDCRIINGKLAEHSEGDFILKILTAKKSFCGRCRKYVADKSNEPCLRCQDVMSDQWK